MSQTVGADSNTVAEMPPYSAFYGRCAACHNALLADDVVKELVKQAGGLRAWLDDAWTEALASQAFNPKLKDQLWEMPPYHRVPLSAGLLISDLWMVRISSIHDLLSERDEDLRMLADDDHFGGSVSDLLFWIYAAEWERISEEGPLPGLEATAVKYLRDHFDV